MYESVCDKDRAAEITLSSFGWSAPTALAGLIILVPLLLLSKVITNMQPLMILCDERVCVPLTAYGTVVVRRHLQ